MVDGTTAAMAPSAVSLSATWDLDIISKLGDLLATEMRDKKADILLAPTGVLDLALMHSALHLYHNLALTSNVLLLYLHHKLTRASLPSPISTRRP